MCGLSGKHIFEIMLNDLLCPSYLWCKASIKQYVYDVNPDRQYDIKSTFPGWSSVCSLFTMSFIYNVLQVLAVFYIVTIECREYLLWLYLHEMAHVFVYILQCTFKVLHVYLILIGSREVWIKSKIWINLFEVLDSARHFSEGIFKISIFFVKRWIKFLSVIICHRRQNSQQFIGEKICPFS